MIWVVNEYEGTDALQEYRKQRLNDTDEIENFRGGDCFHNGVQLRRSVVAMHSRITSNIRHSDNVTSVVLSKVETMLRKQPDARQNAKQLLYEIEFMMQQAKRALQSGTNQSSLEGASRTYSGQIRPPSEESIYSLAHRPNRQSDASQNSSPLLIFPGRMMYRSPRETISDQRDLDPHLRQSRNSAFEIGQDDMLASKFSTTLFDHVRQNSLEQDSSQSGDLRRSRSERIRQGPAVSFAHTPHQVKSHGDITTPSKQKKGKDPHYPGSNNHYSHFEPGLESWYVRGGMSPTQDGRRIAGPDPFIDSSPPRHDPTDGGTISREMQAPFDAED